MLLIIALLKTLFFGALALYDMCKSLCKKEKVKKITIEHDTNSDKIKNLAKVKANVFVCRNLSQEDFEI